MRFDTAIIDVDGTLVDSNYHHTRAWQRAFREVGLVIPAWRIHRAIGMSGDRLVPYLAGASVEKAQGDNIRDVWKREVDAVLHEITALDEATTLFDALRRRGLKVVLASSGKPDHTEHALDVLEARGRVDHVTTSQDVATTKPSPDLLTAALAAVEGTCGIVFGDTVWDARAARRAGMRMIGLLTGGFGRDELSAAGSAHVYHDLPDLLADLDMLLSPGAATRPGNDETHRSSDNL